jgi:hypothetical protein
MPIKQGYYILKMIKYSLYIKAIQTNRKRQEKTDNRNIIKF